VKIAVSGLAFEELPLPVICSVTLAAPEGIVTDTGISPSGRR